jgi:selenocysteine lyase/cysteine desulfurase
MDFLELRAAIPATSSMTYLNTGWAGPSPTRVIERMRAVAEHESALGPAGPDGLAYGREIEAEAKAGVGKLLNVSPSDVLLTHGTTEGVNVVLQGLAWEPGDALVISDLEHPGLKAPSAVVEEQRGAAIARAVVPPNASVDQALTAIKHAITPTTKLVAISHVMFTSGLRLPADEIVRMAHDAGALVLFDGAQTGGHIALDLTAMGVDFYTISGQKWLMGPTGSGALYVNPASASNLTPLFTRAGLDSRTGLEMHGLASLGVVDRAGFAEALAIHDELGDDAVEQRTHALGTRLRGGMTAIDGVSINGPTSGETATAITAITVEGWEPEPMFEALWAQHRVAVRNVAYPPGLRFCTGPFNNEDDVDTAVAAVRTLAGNR